MREPRARRRGLSDRAIALLPRKTKRYVVADPEMRGHYIRVPPQGPAVFAAVVRDPYGRQTWATIGTAAELTIEQARERAREALRRIKEGKPAFEPPKPRPESVAIVAENWLRRHVERNGMRTAPELRRHVEKYILPYWADRTFIDIKRADIATLLDVIEDRNGPAMADAILNTLRSIGSWLQARDDTYAPPFVKGMGRVPKDQRARARILTDDELRSVWQAAGDAGKFGAFVKLLLLTAQRKQKVATLRWSDIAGDVWTIAAEPGEKNNAGRLLLPPVALKIIHAQPRFVSNPYVFAAGRGNGHYHFAAALKTQFDAASGVTGWRLHDCRRSARSLMSRAGVLSEHAERVLGHSFRGVEKIYNRHSFDAEKADALRKLAALIEHIVTPPVGNIVAMREAVS